MCYAKPWFRVLFTYLHKERFFASGLAPSYPPQRFNTSPAVTSLGLHTNMSIAVGVIGLAITIGQIIEDSFSFSDDCRQLKGRCSAVQAILTENELRELPTMAQLETQVQECAQYLESCKKRRFVRNPVFEVTFHRKIGKYVAGIDSWIIIATLALLVFFYIVIAELLIPRGKATQMWTQTKTARLASFRQQQWFKVWRIKA